MTGSGEVFKRNDCKVAFKTLDGARSDSTEETGEYEEMCMRIGDILVAIFTQNGAY